MEVILVLLILGAVGYFVIRRNRKNKDSGGNGSGPGAPPGPGGDPNTSEKQR